MGSFARLFTYIKRRAFLLGLGLGGMVVFTLLSLAPPLLLRSLINDIVQPGLWTYLPPVIALMILVPMLSALMQFGNNILIMLAGNRLVADIRRDIYGRIMDLSLKYHQDHSSGILVNRLMDDVNMLQRLLTGDTVNMIIDLIIFLFSVSIVFTISETLALILTLTLLLYVLAYNLFAQQIKRETAGYRAMQDRISERLQETTAGVRHVRIYGKETEESSIFIARTTESLKHAYASTRNSVKLGTSCNLIAGFGSAVLVVIGASMVMEGRLTYGDILAVNSYVWMALNPAIRLTTLAGQLTETFVSVRRVFELLDEPIDVVSPAGAPPIKARQGRVEFRAVDFSYVPAVPLYRGLNLTVEPGQTVALVGHTGCGKSTLTQLLMRHWDIQAGEILIDGWNIAEVELKSLRRLFGVVLQDSVVFDGTLAENISYGRPGASREEIEEAAQAAEILDLARRLPKGFDNQIGTYGVRLSLGEKQRVSIARAVLKNPLILIMDEATSSLDSTSEALIQKALRNVLHGRTSFVVAHRLSTITSADQILVMERGAIVEQGRHEELMNLPGGRYRQYYEELKGRTEEAGA